MKNLRNTLKASWDRFFEKKNKYGLTADETGTLVSWSMESVRGYDLAMELAVMGYGITVQQFDSLLKDHGIKRK